MGEEFFDNELVGMVNFTDDTVPQQMPVMEHKAAPKAEPPQARGKGIGDGCFF